MGEQVANGHGTHWRVRQLRYVGGSFIIETQFASLDQLHAGDGRHCLGVRRDAEEMVRRQRNFGAQVGESHCVIEKQFPIFTHRDLSADERHVGLLKFQKVGHIVECILDRSRNF